MAGFVNRASRILHYLWGLGQADRFAGAARAVGRAVGANPVALWIPCHRVVRAMAWRLSLGLERKRALLLSEQADLSALAWGSWSRPGQSICDVGPDREEPAPWAAVRLLSAKEVGVRRVSPNS